MNQKVKNNVSSDRISKPLLCLKQYQINELLVLAGLIVLLTLYLLLRSTAGFSYKLPKFDQITDIENIRWSRNNNELSLRKDGGQWYIDQYPAKQSYVDTLLEQLGQPNLQDLVSQSGNLLTFGLDEERAYKLDAFNSQSDVLRTLYIGKSSSSGRYSFVRLNTQDSRVFTLSENLTAILEKNIDELRDRLVLSYSSSDIERLEIRKIIAKKSEAEEALEEGQFVLVEKKDDKWQIPEGALWNEEKVNRLINRFASMNAQDFLPEYPQAAEEYQLKFIAKGGVNYTVTIAAEPLQSTAESKGYAAKSSSYGFPFTLNDYTVESMLEDFGFVQPEAAETELDTP